MSDPDGPQPGTPRAATASAGVNHAITGVALVVVAVGVLLAVGESYVVLTLAAVAVIGSGCYLVVAGAVARGVQLAGTSRPADPPSRDA